MVMVIVMLLVILIVMSFGLLAYSHIELMKTVKEVDRVINDDDV